MKPQILNKYLMLFCQAKVKAQRLGEAAAALTKFDPPLVAKNFKMYNQLCLLIFRAGAEKEVTYLRSFLFKLIVKFEEEKKINNKAYRTFLKYLQIAHLVNFKRILDQNSAKALSMRIKISLLRHSQYLRVDKLYLDAGKACKEQNKIPMAFLWLSKYLDVHDAIEDPDEGIDLPDDILSITDIPSVADVKLADS